MKKAAVHTYTLCAYALSLHSKKHLHKCNEPFKITVH